MHKNKNYIKLSSQISINQISVLTSNFFLSKLIGFHFVFTFCKIKLHFLYFFSSSISFLSFALKSSKYHESSFAL